MIFDESTHTDVAIACARALEAALPAPEAARVFDACVCAYGEERGRRMAMRAAKAGAALTYNAYQAFGEWRPTRPGLSKIRVLEGGPGQYRYQCLSCPWHDRFAARGATDVARRYCALIDQSIARGFSPDLRFTLHESLPTGDACDFTFAPWDGQVRISAPDDAWRPFDYHTAHMYHSMRATIQRACAISDEVLPRMDNQLAALYGDVFFAAMAAFSPADFEHI